MKNLLILGIWAIFASCSENKPDTIVDRIILDTISAGDSTVVNHDLVLPGDKTNVADTVGPKTGPVH